MTFSGLFRSEQEHRSIHYIFVAIVKCHDPEYVKEGGVCLGSQFWRAKNASWGKWQPLTGIVAGERSQGITCPTAERKQRAKEVK